VIQSQFYSTKLDYLKFGFKCKKKKDKNRHRSFFASLEFDFLGVQLKFAFRIRPLGVNTAFFKQVF